MATDLVQVARQIVFASSDRAFQSDRQLLVAQRVDRYRRRLVNEKAAALLADPTFMDTFLTDYCNELKGPLMESMRPDGDPTAFRAEVMRIALSLADFQVPQMTAADLSDDGMDDSNEL